MCFYFKDKTLKGETMQVLSGIQPSGKLHIGNYFGAMKTHIELQDKYDTPIYFIADYHALTTMSGKELKENIFNAAADYLALGLDPSKAILFTQSSVPAVNELAWILSSITPMGLLERCHSYKDKLANGIAPNHGIFAYPVLMAADILLYQAELVPVGKDQKQHIEVTRDIAIKFNNLFGEILTIPKPHILEGFAVIPGIDGQKMSKSYNNTIEIFEEEKKLRKKVMRIKTDSCGIEDSKNPDTCNVFNLYKLFATPEEIENLKDRYINGPLSYKESKDMLLEKITTHFAPYRKKREELQNNPEYVEQVLAEGGKKAQAMAEKTLQQVRKAVGLA